MNTRTADLRARQAVRALESTQETADFTGVIASLGALAFLNTIPETLIDDGAVLARVAADETITGRYVHSTAGVLLATLAAISGATQADDGLFTIQRNKTFRAAASPVISGTRIGTSFAAPSAVGTGESLVDFIAAGYDGSAVASAGILRWVTTQAWTSTAHGVEARILAVANGSTTSVNVATFAPAEIQLDATLLDFNGNLDVSGTALFASTVEIESAAPRMLFDESDQAGSNERLWSAGISASKVFELNTRTTADGAGQMFLQASRGTGTALTEVRLEAGVNSGAVFSATGSLVFRAPTSQSVDFTVGGVVPLQVTESGITSTVNIAGIGAAVFTNIETADGSGLVGFFGTGGGEAIALYSLPAATSTAFVTNGPTAAQSIIDSTAGPIVLSINLVEYARLTTTFASFRVPVRLPAYTVAGLPAGAQGDTALVTNALAPAFGAAVAGGGAAIVPVYHTGAAWFVG